MRQFWVGDGRVLQGLGRPVVGFGEVNGRAERHDAGRINGFMAAVIVRFDVVHEHRFCDAGILVEVADIGCQVRIIDQALQVAFEMADIDRVETHQCGEQPPVGLGQRIARQERRSDKCSSNQSRVSNSGTTASS